MNSSALLEDFDQSIRRNCRFIGREVERLEKVTRVTGPSADSIDNVVIWSDLTPGNAEQIIDEQIDYFGGLNHAFEWIHYEQDSPPNLVSILLDRGFTEKSREEVVIAPAKEISQLARVPYGITLKSVVDESGIPDAIDVQVKIWGAQYHDFLTRWTTDLLNQARESTIILVAYDGDKPVGSAWTIAWDDRIFAPMFGGSVLPEYRRRGIYQAMVAARADAIAEKGIEWCLVDAGEKSLPILKKQGFQKLTQKNSYQKIPGNAVS